MGLWSLKKTIVRLLALVTCCLLRFTLLNISKIRRIHGVNKAQAIDADQI